MDTGDENVAQALDVVAEAALALRLFGSLSASPSGGWRR